MKQFPFSDVLILVQTDQLPVSIGKIHLPDIYIYQTKLQ